MKRPDVLDAEASADHAKRRRYVRIMATVHVIIQVVVAVIAAYVYGPPVAYTILAVGLVALVAIVATSEYTSQAADDAEA